MSLPFQYMIVGNAQQIKKKKLRGTDDRNWRRAAQDIHQVDTKENNSELFL